MITKIIDKLHSGKFYGCGNNVEIAKGKNELVIDFKGFKEKIKRIWLRK